MPISLDYDSVENVIFTKATGAINLDDILVYLNSIAGLDLPPGYRVLADYSETTLELSNADLFEMAQRRKAMQTVDEKIRIAVYCKANLVFGLARMYEAFLADDHHEVMIFRGRKDALKWLDL